MKRYQFHLLAFALHLLLHRGRLRRATPSSRVLSKHEDAALSRVMQPRSFTGTRLITKHLAGLGRGLGGSITVHIEPCKTTISKEVRMRSGPLRR